MLSNCDEIIRQHKAACLRVTSLLCCKDLIWIGTSAGVLLTIPAQGYEKGAHNIVPTGIPHGHTGHVRFLTFVESPTHGLEGCSQIISAATSRETGSGTSDDYTKQGCVIVQYCIINLCTVNYFAYNIFLGLQFNKELEGKVGNQEYTYYIWWRWLRGLSQLWCQFAE